MSQNETYRNWESFAGCGMVLEGGGSRGVFTAGVLDYFMEKNLYLPYTVGVSAGACNALDYASGQIGRSRDTFIIRDRKLHSFSLKHFMKTKYVYDMDMLFDLYPNRYFPYDFEMYQKIGMRVESVVTNLLTGKAEYLSEYEDRKRLMEIARASSSMPALSPVVTIDGKPFMDGGLSDSIPYGRSIMRGNRKHVVILTRQKGYRKSANSVSLPLIKKLYADRPALIRAYKNRPAVYNRQLDILERLEEEGRLFVIRPTEKPVGRTEANPDRLESFYEHGYNVGVEIYDDVLNYLRS